MRLGRRLGVDVGKVRIGLAVSDLHGILASPLATVVRAESLSETAERILKETADFELLEIYAGLPIGMQGQHTASTQDAIDVMAELARVCNCEIRFIDERLTTVSASANLRQHGISSKNQRQIIDQEAAVLILENALNQERVSGTTPGRTFSEL
ncbi:MAG: Holliday junction resolvase RuvX [Micrococcales bacterium]